MLAAYYPFEVSDRDATVADAETNRTGAEGPRLELSLSEPREPAPRPGSLEETLLQTTRQDRDSMLFRTIRERGFECPAIAMTQPVGRDGRDWRANCGGGLIYTVRVDEFGGLSVDPAPYGDVDPRTTRPEVEVIEEDGQRRLRLQQ